MLARFWAGDIGHPARDHSGDAASEDSASIGAMETGLPRPSHAASDKRGAPHSGTVASVSSQALPLSTVIYCRPAPHADPVARSYTGCHPVLELTYFCILQRQ